MKVGSVNEEIYVWPTPLVVFDSKENLNLKFIGL